MTIEIDRTGWPRGPWDDEPDEEEWVTAAGLKARVERFIHDGGLRGYVEVRKTDAVFGEHYSDAVDNRVSVHGGLTYSSHRYDPNGAWWFGFDASHAYDIVPFNPYRAPLRDPKAQYRTWKYMRGQCEELAKQLLEFKRCECCGALTLNGRATSAREST